MRVRPAVLSEKEKIKGIFDNNIGIDFYSNEDVEKMFLADNKYLYVCVDDSDEIMGVFYFVITSFEEAKKILLIPENTEEISFISSDSKIGILKTASTDIRFRKRGVYTMLQNAGEKLFRDNHAQYILVTGTKYDSEEALIHGTMSSTGFKKMMVIHHPWNNLDCYCQVCKKMNCICDSVLYMKALEE